MLKRHFYKGVRARQSPFVSLHTTPPTRTRPALCDDFYDKSLKLYLAMPSPYFSSFISTFTLLMNTPLVEPTSATMQPALRLEPLNRSSQERRHSRESVRHLCKLHSQPTMLIVNFQTTTRNSFSNSPSHSRSPTRSSLSSSSSS